MTGAGFASCSQPIPSYTVMGSIPDSTFNGKTVYIFDRDKGQNIGTRCSGSAVMDLRKNAFS